MVSLLVAGGLVVGFPSHPSPGGSNDPVRAAPRMALELNGGVSAFQVRAAWGEADCWVIALGSNDLIFGGDDPIVAASMIDSMLAAVTPKSRIWWVNLDYHLDPRVPFDFVRATANFNAVLDARAAAHTDLTVIDWFSLAESHLDWFSDPVHVDSVGSRARADQAVEALAN
jgi:hypothetical protein